MSASLETAQSHVWLRTTDLMGDIKECAWVDRSWDLVTFDIQSIRMTGSQIPGVPDILASSGHPRLL